MALSTLLQEIQSSGEVDIGRYRHIYGFTVNAGANQRISINVIGAVSDILIAASPFISCSIPGTTCRRSGMMISKLDCVFEWYLPITLSFNPSLSKLVSLSLKPVFLRPAYPGKTLYFPYSDVSSSSERGEWALEQRQQCIEGQAGHGRGDQL
ncbi:hypothetical protein EDD85DRAFT_106446 [Armillaria nabsnona]|nr:hypothetical protein EDD85DRAFT_106446 [Armillaria nabsnona]